MRILATAFDPCTDDPAPNPSEVLVARLTPPPGARLYTLTLPTVYGQADHILRRAIVTTVPDLVLLTGVSGRADPVKLETVARNSDTSPRPDNAGRTGDPVIVLDGPATLPATLPLDTVLPALDTAGVRYTLSDDAGGYLCNHAYYVALHALRHLRVACMFVHIGFGDEAIDEGVRAAETMIRALDTLNAPVTA